MAEVELSRLINQGWEYLEGAHKNEREMRVGLQKVMDQFRALANRAERLQAQQTELEAAHQGELERLRNDHEGEILALKTTHHTELMRVRLQLTNEPGMCGSSVHWLGDSGMCHDALVIGVNTKRYTRRELNVRHTVSSGNGWCANTERVMKDVAYADHNNPFIANTWHLPGAGCLMAGAEVAAPPAMTIDVPAQRVTSDEHRRKVAEATEKMVKQTYGWESCGLGRGVHYVNSAKTCSHAVVIADPMHPREPRRLSVFLFSGQEQRTNVKHRGEPVAYSREWEANTWHTVSECSRAKREG